MTEEQNNITEAEANNLESLENANVEVKPEVELVSENSSSPKSEEIDLSEYSSASLEQILVNLEKAFIEKPKTASKVFIAVRPLFFEKFENEKSLAKEEFLKANEDEEAIFEFAKDGLQATFNDLGNKIKQARQEERDRIEQEKAKNLALKKELLAALEAIVKEDETLDSIQKVKDIQKQWKLIRVLPKDEVQGLWDDYNLLLDKFYDNHSINIELKELDRRKNLEAKIELTKKVEEVNKEKSLKRSFILLNKYHEEFRNIGPVPQESREPIWQAFKMASDAVYEGKRKEVDALELVKEENLKRKEILAEKAELLNAVTPNQLKDWNQKYTEFETLFDEWKKIGPVPKSNNDAVWLKFNGVRNDFYTKRKEFFKVINDERKENLSKKEALCVKVEALQNSEDWMATSNEIIRLQNEWKTIGPVPDKVNQSIWKRFRGACDVFFARKNEAFKGQRAQESENLKLKDALIDELNVLLNAEKDYKEVITDLKRISADWRSIGFVPKKALKRINTDYDAASNAVYQKFNEQIKSQKASNLVEHYANLKQSPNGDKSLDYEMRGIQKKIDFLKEEVAGIERNMSFFAKSKTADKMLKDFEAKIVKSKKQITSLKQELAAIRNVKKGGAEEGETNEGEAAN
jgi:hypothetical protein